MFRQNNVYITTEYGTRPCDEDREPCGAFYGLPFSGEIEEQATYEREQVQACLPERQFSATDELVLAHLRGERLDEELPKSRRRDAMLESQLVYEFRQDTIAPREVVENYRVLVQRYVRDGDMDAREKMDCVRTAWLKRGCYSRYDE